ncbi:putative MFS family arabinose efflux permease [Catenulispora sp. GP43]|uniref:MFS transporter n=1 Tax=Catenulispora sp. GP43 TaxID=3156263 RepID=UPI003512932F
MTKTTQDRDTKRSESLWRNRDFLAVWSGQIVSTLGTSGSATAVPLFVLAATSSAADAGLVTAVTALPALIIQLPAGTLADRWNRLRVLAVSELLTGLALLLVPIAVWLGHPSLLVLGGAIVVQRCCGVFFGSAERAVLPALVPQGKLGDAIAQNEAKSRAANLIGPPIGGLLFGYGRGLPFLVDAVSSLLAAGGLRLVRADLRPARTSAPTGLWRETGRGLAWIVRQPLIRTAILLIAVSNMVFQALTLILIVLVRRHGATSAEVGLMFGLYSAGGMIGAIAAPRLYRRLSPKSVIVVTNWIWAAQLPLFLLTGNPLILGLIGAGCSFLGPIWNVVAEGYFITQVPDELRGRVSGAAMAVSSGVIPLAAAASGYLLAAAGPSRSIVVITVVMLATAVVGTVSPAIRSAQHNPAGQNGPA